MSESGFAKAACGRVLQVVGTEELYGVLYARLKEQGAPDSYYRPISAAVRDLGAKHPGFESVRSAARQHSQKMKNISV